MALEMHPGKLTELVKPSFPDAITVAIPTLLKLSMLNFLESVSQYVKD